MTSYNNEERVNLKTYTHSALLLCAVSALIVANPISHAGEAVTLNLSATINQSCSLERTGSASQAGATLSEAAKFSVDTGSLTLGFNINCNSPFRYSLTSKNGGLVNTASPEAAANSDSMLTHVGYKTTFNVELEDGDLTSINQGCVSSSLARAVPECKSGVGFADSGTSVAIDNAVTLKIELDATTFTAPLLDGIPLMAGTFQDNLILKVETSL